MPNVTTKLTILEPSPPSVYARLVISVELDGSPVGTVHVASGSPADLRDYVAGRIDLPTLKRLFLRGR